MPHRKVAVAAIMLLGCSSNAPSSQSAQIAIDDGKPVSVRHGKTIVQFDGDNDVLLVRGGKTISIPARSPAMLTLSPDDRYAAYNFGNGSGQVYSLSIYDLRTGAEVRVADPLVLRLTRRAAGAGCRAGGDAVSVLFEKWTGVNSYLVRTEDLSRQPNCASLAGEWKMSEAIEPGDDLPARSFEDE